MSKEQGQYVSKEEMMELNGITNLNLNPDIVLENTKGKLEGFVICGYDKDGMEYFSSTYSDGGDILWIIERMKLRLLTVEIEE
jgi:hypothetical protein